jgi:hypothetical protein
MFYFEKGRQTWYDVVSGIPNIPDANLKAYSWTGQFDDPIGTTAINRNPEGVHPSARSLRLETIVVTQRKVFAYWLEEQSVAWQELYR